MALLYVRTVIFNICFIVHSIISCFALVWAYALPRAQAVRAIALYFDGVYWLERGILGLDYRVEGREHLPKSGAYILALKHQSAYETLKIIRVFGDVAIILKKELSWIPLWGWYAMKMGAIAVDRGARDKAVQSIIKGGQRVAAEGRPILIFPQGTRVRVTDTTAEKPYKIGIARMAATLDLPIIPVALNCGVFWPRYAFLKRGGVATFKILPALPRGLEPREILKALEDAIEPESKHLVDQALASLKN